MTPEVFSFTKIYPFNDASPSTIVVDHHFRYNNITAKTIWE